MNVKTLIERAVVQYPERTALVFGDRRFTFRELNQRSNRLANGLLALGLKKGDRVGMLMYNCPEFIEIDLALSKTGIVRVPLNARLTVDDHCYTLEDAGAGVLIYSQEHAPAVERIKERLEGVGKFILIDRGAGPAPGGETLDYEALLAGQTPDDPGVEISEEDLHTLFYTSGTTGQPKGVMLTQKSWASVVINLVTDYGPIGRDDVILNTQPLSHGAGFFVLPYFIKGGTNVLIPQFSPEAVFETIERERVTVLKLVPVMLYGLLDYEGKGNYPLKSLKTIIYGGSPISPVRLAEAVEHFGPRLMQLFGQAEAPMCVTVLNKRDHVVKGPDEEVRRLSSAGKPCTNVELRIVDEGGRDLPRKRWAR